MTMSSSSLSNKILIQTDELEKLLTEEPERLSILNASYQTADYYDPKENHMVRRI